jgi:hypothetical protein
MRVLAERVTHPGKGKKALAAMAPAPPAPNTLPSSPAASPPRLTKRSIVALWCLIVGVFGCLFVYLKVLAAVQDGRSIYAQSKTNSIWTAADPPVTLPDAVAVAGVHSQAAAPCVPAPCNCAEQVCLQSSIA